MALETALKRPDRVRTKGSGSCSALIKLLPNNADLYVAHDTWSEFQSMLRIIKKYEFPFHITENCKYFRDNLFVMSTIAY